MIFSIYCCWTLEGTRGGIPGSQFYWNFSSPQVKAGHHILDAQNWNSQIPLLQLDFFFFTGLKLTDHLSQATSILHGPWYPSWWLHDLSTATNQEEMYKFLICQIKAELTQQRFQHQMNTRSSIAAHKGKQNLLFFNTRSY